MNAINELSCEFAATVFERMDMNKQMTPQDAANLIRNFYDALENLQEKTDRARLEKPSLPESAAKEKAIGGNH